jgi:hypothetical protein
MIDFKQVWLPQIVTYARLISTGQLEDQWLGRSGITTSVSGPDELHEQIFGDLDAVAIWAVARQGEGMSTSALSAVDTFLTALSGLNDNDAATIVGSSAWAVAKVAAGEVLTNVC